MTELTTEKIDSLIELCTSMLNQSYCPYSRFAVGAVLVTDCGKIFTGKLILFQQLSIRLTPLSSNNPYLPCISYIIAHTSPGCNVESASYGLAICAERTAAVKAVSEGFRKFKACFVTTRSPSKVLPCGACRQFLAEVSCPKEMSLFGALTCYTNTSHHPPTKFGLDLQLYLIGSDGTYEIKTLREVLPNAFTPAELDSGVV